MRIPDEMHERVAEFIRTVEMCASRPFLHEGAVELNRDIEAANAVCECGHAKWQHVDGFCYRYLVEAARGHVCHEFREPTP